MNVNRSSLLWGILLIGFGVLFLGMQMGYFGRLSESVLPWIFALLGLLGFLSYALSGWTQWGWLFPAGVFGGLAITAALAMNNVDNAAVGSPLFFGLLIPFVAAYLTDRTRNWWALIPGGVMLFLALTTLLVDNVGGEWVGSMFLFLIGLSFFVVYLNNRTRNWALLVAYILFVLSIAPAMASGGGDLAAYLGPVFLFAIGLPFFVIYLRSMENWWAIIPAGAMTVLALITALALAGWIRNASQGWYVFALLLGGLAVSFGVIWLRHAKDWAKVVSITLAAVAVASVFFATPTGVVLPVLFILAGAYLLYNSMRHRTA